MNILYYLKGFPKLSESFVLNEIYALEQAGHRVAVFAQGSGGCDLTHTEFSSLNAPIHQAGAIDYKTLITLLSNPTQSLSPLISPPDEHGVKSYIKNSIRTNQCIEFVSALEWNIDTVHTHFATTEKYPAMNVATYFDVPFTVTTHAFDIYREFDRSTYKLLTNADRIITISEYNRDYLSKKIRKQVPIDIVHAGIRPEKFSPAGSPVENRILTVARLTDKKGLHYALEAVAIAVCEIPELEYHIVGSGELYEELVRTTTELGIEDNVTFLDNISDAQLIAEYEEARSFVLPCVITEAGERDGIPVALMEAMAMNTPPVSTIVSGIPELIDHETNGLLVKPRDPEATAEALLRVLRNDAEHREFCRHGRRKVIEQFDVMEEVTALERSFRKARDESCAVRTEKDSRRTIQPDAI